MNDSAKIKGIKKLLSANPAIEFAYLFGSRAIGRADERSDWDIAVYYKNPKRLRQWASFYLEADISKEVGGEVQVVVLNSLDSPVFLFEIVKDGILLADKDTEKRILFEAGALRNFHDWSYFQNRHMTTRQGK